MRMMKLLILAVLFQTHFDYYRWVNLKHRVPTGVYVPMLPMPEWVNSQYFADRACLYRLPQRPVPGSRIIWVQAPASGSFYVCYDLKGAGLK